MDEEQRGSNPSDKTDQKRIEPTVESRTTNATTPGESSGGGWTDETQAHYDPDEPRDLTTVIIGAIADAEEVPIIEVKTPPLYEVVDIEAIEAALFGRPTVSGDGTDSTVEFRYNEYRVAIKSDGWVTVADRSDESTPT